jgi:hypothetical protein
MGKCLAAECDSRLLVSQPAMAGGDRSGHRVRLAKRRWRDYTMRPAFAALAFGVLIASCSCAAAHELDGGFAAPDTAVDGGPPLFPMCGNPIAPGNCSSDDVCMEWAASFGASGAVQARCFELRTGDGSSRGSVCFMGSYCPDPHHVTGCSCAAGLGCRTGEVCIQDPGGGPSRCVAGCTDLSQCYPSQFVMRTDTHPGFSQAPYCPDAGM